MKCAVSVRCCRLIAHGKKDQLKRWLVHPPVMRILHDGFQFFLHPLIYDSYRLWETSQYEAGSPHQFVDLLPVPVSTFTPPAALCRRLFKVSGLLCRWSTECLY